MHGQNAESSETPAAGTGPKGSSKAWWRFRRDVRGEWRGLKRSLLTWRTGLWLLAGVLAYGLMARFLDGRSLEGMSAFYRANPNGEAKELAAVCQWFNQAGDFVYTVLIFLGLLCAHSLWKSAYLRRLAVGVLISSLLVGAAARVGKVLLGRARPRTVIHYKCEPWYCKGPTLNPDYHSFPSGHTSFAAAGSGPLLMAEPLVGLPLTLGTLFIGGSRIGGMYHHPSDVLAGLWLGSLVGCASGLRLRRLSRRAKRLAAYRRGRGVGAVPSFALPKPELGKLVP